tara:strand:+ start:69 stop:944 length:876 start_codon:yes stop_codon:yes gene_type:complete
MHKFIPVSLIAFLLALAPTGGVAQDGASGPDGEEAYEAAIDAWALAQKEHRDAVMGADTDEEQERIWSEERPDPDQFASAFLAVAEAHPGGEVALDCLGWVAGNAQDNKLVDFSIRVVLKQHLQQAGLSGFVDSIARSSNISAERALQTIFTSSPHRDVKGKACYHLGMKKLSSARLARRVAELVESGLDPLEAFNGYYTEVAVTRAKGLDPKVIQAVGERLLDRVVNEFGDIKGRRSTLGESAAAELFELRSLQIGMTAPEIEGVGIDEKPMKLSDFGGKVILLDFWGDW